MVHDEKEIENVTPLIGNNIDYEKAYYRWCVLNWALIFLSHESEVNSILYWTMGCLGMVSFLISLFYLYKWFRE